MDYMTSFKKRSPSNARNGYSKKKLRTTIGETEIAVPRDRDSSYNTMLVKKRESLKSVFLALRESTKNRRCPLEIGS